MEQNPAARPRSKRGRNKAKESENIKRLRPAARVKLADDTETLARGIEISKY